MSSNPKYTQDAGIISQPMDFGKFKSKIGNTYNNKSCV